MNKIIILIVVFFAQVNIYSQNDNLKIYLTEKQIKQGHSFGVFISSKFELKNITARVGNRLIRFFNIYKSRVFRAIIGIDVDEKPGNYNIIFNTHTIEGKKFNAQIEYNVIPFVFRQTTVDGRAFRPAVVYTPRMLKILEARDELKKEREYIAKILMTVTPEQFWLKKFSLPTTWIKYIEKKENGKKIKVAKETPIFGAKRINVTNRGSIATYHRGVDYGNFEGTKIIASARGMVITARSFKARGNTVIINHGQGILTIYCHLSKLNVKEGDMVHHDQIIGQMGETGLATGSHLHFEIRVNGISVTPDDWINYKFFYPLFY